MNKNDERNIIRIISTEDELSNYLASLRQNGINRLALDLEGDQGSINYKYSVSIIQCFDGIEPVIIDVLKTSGSSALKDLLTCDDIIKVMFSSENDIYMTQNVLGCTIKPVHDIAVAQKLLGIKVNLASHIGVEKNIKNAYQRANWLKRPLIKSLIDYAINDVMWLLKIEDDLSASLREKGLYGKYEQINSGISQKNFKVDQFLIYKDKFPGYRRMSSEKKELSRTLWIFREMLGEHYNCPVGYLLSKKAMLDIVLEQGDVLVNLYDELNKNRNNRKKLDLDLVIKYYEKAKAYSKKLKTDQQ